MTGFYRDGYCRTGADDSGRHTVCILATDEFLAYSKSVGNDLSTLPDFPAEIRAPAGTLPGVSGFQIHFSSGDVFTPGDEPDVLVAMNPAALRANLSDVPRGATIIGGLFFGLSRKAATEFSFFLAVPTLIAAGAYQLYKERGLLSMQDLDWFAAGMIAAFLSAFACVRWFLRYVMSHDFSLFAWYRIAFGLIVLISAYAGVSWNAK